LATLLNPRVPVNASLRFFLPLKNTLHHLLNLACMPHRFGLRALQLKLDFVYQVQPVSVPYVRFGDSVCIRIWVL
jgi:hypothetical protein